MPFIVSNFIISNVAVSFCSLVFFYVFGKYLSDYLSRFSSIYQSLERKSKEEWHFRNLSTLHAILSCILSLIVFVVDKQVLRDPFLGVSWKAETVVSITTGYIISDMLYLFTSSPATTDAYWTSLVHHFVVLMPYAAVMASGTLLYFALIRLLAEVSTPFVNFRWMLDVANMKSTRLYFYNGWIMLITFFICRILAMPYCYYLIFAEYGAPDFERVQFFIYFYTFNGAIVDLLNIYWFNRMVKGAVKYYNKKDE